MKIEQIRKWLHELAVQLMCAHPAEIDQEINNCLKIAGEAWGFDRISLAELSGDRKSVEITHSFLAPGQAPGSEESSFSSPEDDLSWLSLIHI